LICLCHTSFESCTVDHGESIPTSLKELSEILCKDIDIVKLFFVNCIIMRRRYCVINFCRLYYVGHNWQDAVKLNKAFILDTRQQSCFGPNYRMPNSTVVCGM
jgi:hypothetical protein